MNERGAVSVLLLTLSPLLIATSAVALAGYLLLAADGRARHTCRTELLRSQADVARSLNALIALNPEARRLRHRRSVAEAKAAATVGTPAHLAAQTELQTIIAMQLALALRQKKWLIRARLITRMAPAQALTRIRGQVLAAQSAGGGSRFPDGWRSLRKSGKLALRSMPASSLTPDYIPEPHLSDSQEIRLRWSFSVSSLLPDWLRPLVDTMKLKTAAECSATLEIAEPSGRSKAQAEPKRHKQKEKSQWQPKLTPSPTS